MVDRTSLAGADDSSAPAEFGRKPMTGPLRHAVRGGAVAVVVALVVATALALLPGTAAADVTVAASRAEAGARDVTITFRVTNADPAVPTTRLEVFLPTARPLLGVAPTAPRGWTARVTTVPPPTPLVTDDGPVAEIAAAVAWEGGTVTGTDYAVFPIDVDRLPDGAGPLRFRVVQTFADGTTVEWSDTVAAGAPVPAHPALVVPYGTAPAAAPAGSGHHHHGGAPDALPTSGAGSSGWIVWLVGALGAMVAAAAAALGHRQRRRLAALWAVDRREHDSG
jgi:uncharacterized protein YcnI